MRSFLAVGTVTSLSPLGVTVLSALLAGAGVSAAFAFDAPDLPALVGGGDPLAIVPDSLTGAGLAHTSIDVTEFYRYRSGQEEQRYAAWSARSLALARSRPVWIGASWEVEHLLLRQREIHERDDALDGDRRVTHAGIVGAASTSRCTVRALAGGSAGGAEGALHFQAAAEPWVRAGVRGWLRRSSLDVDQRLEGSTFHFAFAYRTENVEINLGSSALAGHRVDLRGGWVRIAGDEPDPQRFNRLDVTGGHAEAVIARTTWPQLDLRGHVTEGWLDLTLTLDGTRYGALEDLRLRRRGGEIGWHLTDPVRVAFGMDRWRVESESGFVDLWPFSAWDIFTVTRFRLVSLEKTLDIDYVRLILSPPALGPLDLRFDGRFEWWRDAGRIEWKERVPVLYPFFFVYEHDARSLDWRFTHAIEVDTEIGVRIRPALRARILAQVQFPFGDDRDGDRRSSPDPPVPAPAQGPEAAIHAWGGVAVATSLTATW